MMTFYLENISPARPPERYMYVVEKNKFPLWKVGIALLQFYSFESWQLRNWGNEVGGDWQDREREIIPCLEGEVWWLPCPAMINITRQTQTAACTVQSGLTLIYLKKNRFKVQTKALLEVIGPSRGLFLIINAFDAIRRRSHDRNKCSCQCWS